MMAVQGFQLVVDRFEDDVLALAYYIKDRDVICGKYKLVKSIEATVGGVRVDLTNVVSRSQTPRVRVWLRETITNV